MKICKKVYKIPNKVCQHNGFGSKMAAVKVFKKLTTTCAWMLCHFLAKIFVKDGQKMVRFFKDFQSIFSIRDVKWYFKLHTLPEDTCISPILADTDVFENLSNFVIQILCANCKSHFCIYQN